MTSVEFELVVMGGRRWSGMAGRCTEQESSTWRSVLASPAACTMGSVARSSTPAANHTLVLVFFGVKSGHYKNPVLERSQEM